MAPIRQRMAIGIFANVEDAESASSRLHALGFHLQECFVLPTAPTSSGMVPQVIDQEPVDLKGLVLPASGQIMLRVFLETVLDEQLVAGALLESPAESVQLHDVNLPRAGLR